MKIGIFYDRNKPEAKALAFQMKDWLETGKHQVFLKLSNDTMKNLDFITTFCGDGLILKVADKVKKYKTPMLRVNFGYVGFLSNVKPGEVFEKISEMIDRGNYIITKRARIEVVLWDKDGKIIAQKDALNDIVIERRDTKSVTFRVAANETRNEYRGDALIFATRTGSTGYAESAGGPTLINENRFILRVVSSSNRELLPYLIRPSETVFMVDGILGRTRLVADGEKIANLKDGQTVEIRKSEQETLFIEIGEVEKIKA